MMAAQHTLRTVHLMEHTLVVSLVLLDRELSPPALLTSHHYIAECYHGEILGRSVPGCSSNTGKYAVQKYRLSF
jgi:hypothetical protein